MQKDVELFFPLLGSISRIGEKKLSNKKQFKIIKDKMSYYNT